MSWTHRFSTNRSSVLSSGTLRHTRFKLLVGPCLHRLLVHHWYSTGTLLVQYWYTTGTVLVQYWYTADTVLVHHWYSTGTPLIQSSWHIDHLAASVCLRTSQWSWMRVCSSVLACKPCSLVIDNYQLLYPDYETNISLIHWYTDTLIHWYTDTLAETLYYKICLNSRSSGRRADSGSGSGSGSGSVLIEMGVQFMTQQ